MSLEVGLYGSSFIGEQATIGLWSIYESKIIFTFGHSWPFEQWRGFFIQRNDKTCHAVVARALHP
jgi:hypothetical protein